MEDGDGLRGKLFGTAGKLKINFLFLQSFLDGAILKIVNLDSFEFIEPSSNPDPADDEFEHLVPEERKYYYDEDGYIHYLDEELESKTA